MSNIWCRLVLAAVATAVALALAIAPTLAAPPSSQKKGQARVQVKTMATKKTQAQTTKRRAITAITRGPAGAPPPAGAAQAPAFTGNWVPRLDRGGCYKALSAPVTKTFMKSAYTDPSAPPKVCTGVEYTVFLGGEVWCLTCGSNNQASDGSCLGTCNAGFLFKAAGGGQCCKGIDPRPDVDLQKYKTK